MCSPLADIAQINERLDAVQDLVENIEVVRCFQNKAWKIPDFEKLFSSIYQFSMRSHHTLISFENIPGLKLKEFYLVLDQLKYLKYVIGVFSPYITDRKF